MARTIINDQYLTDIAVAIRNKNKSETLYKPKEMAAAIDAIEGGVAEPVIEALEITANGTYEAPEGIDGYSPITVEVPATGTELPEDAFDIRGNCMYRLSYNGWNWFVETFGDKIITDDILDLTSFAYASSQLTKIPFDLNIFSECHKLASVFAGCYELTEVPKIIGELKLPQSNYTYNAAINRMFYQCQKLKEIPYDYFYSIGGKDYWIAAQPYTGARSHLFAYCYSLRELPDISILINKASYINCLSYNMCEYCYSLNAIYNMPVADAAVYTSNAFGYFVDWCARLKALTFATNEDGSPKTVQWKNQILDLSKFIGYAASGEQWNMVDYYGNSEEKQVVDAETYELLKDDPDWWTANIDYSRYNHDSAVATINSLPDASAYGTNTIKFTGAAGALTDGGAINTLTEEEIAVATAKGWTVSLV